MLPYRKTLSLALAAYDADGICQSQSAAGAGSLTINGALASGGAVTMDAARRVGITSAGDDSSITFTITGTDRSSKTQSETLTGANAGSVESLKDFLTVTAVTVSAATASTVTVGTTGKGSTAPYIADLFSDPNGISFGVKISGTATWRLEYSYEDLSPQFDLNANTPIWFSDVDVLSTHDDGADLAGRIIGPVRMVRLTVLSGTGTVTADLIQPKNL